MKTDLVVTGFIFNNDKLLLIHHDKLNKWLPVGGHIEKDEVPDDAMIREAKEETNLDIEILSDPDIPAVADIKRSLSIPFHVNVHSVGDHDHCTLCYICRAKNPESLIINKELRNFKWISKEELNNSSLTEGVRVICKKAFELINN
jgi:8-oxo-dGTP diphosphatase